MAREGPNCFMSILIPVASNGTQHKNYQFHEAKSADLHHTDTTLSFTLQLLYSCKQTHVPMKWREGRMVSRACMNAVKKKERNLMPLPGIKLLLLRQGACSLSPNRMNFLASE